MIFIQEMYTNPVSYTHLRENMPDGDMYDGKILYYLGNEYELRLESGGKFEVDITGDRCV